MSANLNTDTSAPDTGAIIDGSNDSITDLGITDEALNSFVDNALASRKDDDTEQPEQQADATTDATDTEATAATDDKPAESATDAAAEPDAATTATTYKRYQTGLNGVANLLLPKDEHTAWKALPVNQQLESVVAAIKAKTERLAELEADATTDGIRINAPADKWDPVPQIAALPPNHRDKLIDTVFKRSMPEFVQRAIDRQATDPDSYKLLNSVASAGMQHFYQRPVAEINTILTMLQGWAPDQLYATLTGAAATPGTYTPPPPGTNAAAQVYPPAAANAQNIAPVYRAMEAAGLDPADPALQQLANVFAAQLAHTNSQLADMGRTLQGHQEATTRAQQDAATQARDAARATIDTQHSAQIQTSVTEALKDSVSADQFAKISGYLLPKVKELIATDPKVQEKLDLARGYAADGLPDKARMILGLVSPKVDYHVAMAAKELLDVLVAKSATQRAGDTTRRTNNKQVTGATAAAPPGQKQGITDILGRIKPGVDLDPETLGNMAAELAGHYT